MVEAIDFCEHWSEALADKAMLSGRGLGRSHTAQKLLKSVQLAWHLRGGADDMKRVIKVALEACLPAEETMGLRHSIDSLLPKPSTVKRHNLSLDMAMMIAQP